MPKSTKIITVSYDALTTDKVCALRRINPTYVKDLAAIAKEAIDGGRDPIKVFSGEPFPRLIVRALPLKEGGKDKSGQPIYEAQRYGIVGGYHRWRAAGELRVKDLEVDVREYKSDAEALSDAISDNLTNGLHLNKDDRDAAILKLHKEFKVSQSDLVKRFGLGKASISRICSGKQRKKGPRKKATKKAQRGGSVVREAMSRPDGFAPAQYMKELRAMDVLFQQHSEALVAWQKDRDGFLSGEFVAFVDDLTKKR